MSSSSFRRQEERRKAEREAQRRETALEAKREKEREEERALERKEAARAETEAERKAEEKQAALIAAARTRRRKEADAERREQTRVERRKEAARGVARDERLVRQRAEERSARRRDAAQAEAHDELLAQQRVEQLRAAGRGETRATHRAQALSEAARADGAAERRAAEREQEAAQVRQAAALESRRQAERARARAADRRAAARQGTLERGGGTSTSSARLTVGAGSGRLRVDGGRVVDHSGAPVVLRGVTVRGLERALPQGDVFEPVLAADEAQTLADWGATVVTIPIAQDLALTGHGDAWAEDYLAALDASVAAATDAGMRAIVQLALLSSELTSRADQPGAPVPDAESIDMWAQVARRYADQPDVLFDLFATPHDPGPGDWTALVMPQLRWPIWGRWVLAIVGEIKRVNPGALVIVRGINGRDLTGFPLHYTEGTRIPNVLYAAELAGEPTATLAALRRLARRAPVAAFPWSPGGPMNASVVETLGRRLADLGAHWVIAGWREPEAPLAVVSKDQLLPTALGRAVQVSLAQPGPAMSLRTPRVSAMRARPTV